MRAHDTIFLLVRQILSAPAKSPNLHSVKVSQLQPLKSQIIFTIKIERMSSKYTNNLSSYKVTQFQTLIPAIQDFRWKQSSQSIVRDKFCKSWKQGWREGDLFTQNSCFLTCFTFLLLCWRIILNLWFGLLFLFISFLSSQQGLVVQTFVVVSFFLINKLSVLNLNLLCQEY